MTFKCQPDWAKDKRVVIAILAVFVVMVLFSRMDMALMQPDEQSHTLGGRAISDIINHVVQGGSVLDIKSMVLSDHAHYKSFSGLVLYPPLHTLLIGISLSMFGQVWYAAILPAVLEAALLAFFIYKIAMLAYRKGEVAMLALIFTCFYAPLFFFAGSAYLDVGAALFAAATIYFLAAFLEKDDKRYLYLTGACLGLGVLMKTPMIIMFVVFLAVLLLLKRDVFTKRKRVLGTTLLISFLIVSPWIAQEAYLKSQGVSPTAYEKWFVHHINDFWDPASSVPEGWPIVDVFSTKYNGTTFFQSIVYYASAIAYQWFLLPFLLLGIFYKRLNDTEKAVIIFLFIMILFLSITDSHTRYALALLPFVMFSAKGLSRAFGSMKHPVVILLIVLSIGQCSLGILGVYHSDTRAIYDYDAASMFIIQDSPGPATIMTSEPAGQAMSLAFNDIERKIYVIYIPFSIEDARDIVSGTFKYDKWERFNIEHPEVNYILVHEDRIGLDKESKRLDYSFNILEFAENVDGFSLAKVVDGKKPNSRIYIFKRGSG